MNYTLDAQGIGVFTSCSRVRHLVAGLQFRLIRAHFKTGLARRPIALPYQDYVIRHAAQMELLVMPLEDVIHTRIGTSTSRADARRTL